MPDVSILLAIAQMLILTQGDVRRFEPFRYSRFLVSVPSSAKRRPRVSGQEFRVIATRSTSSFTAAQEGGIVLVGSCGFTLPGVSVNAQKDLSGSGLVRTPTTIACSNPKRLTSLQIAPS